MKKIFTLLLCAVLLVTFMPTMAWAEEAQPPAATENTEGYDWTVTLDNNQFEKDGVTYYFRITAASPLLTVTVSKDIGKVVIPDTINGKPVTRVKLQSSSQELSTCEILVIGKNIESFSYVSNYLYVKNTVIFRGEIIETSFPVYLYETASVYIPSKTSMDSLMDSCRGDKDDLSVGIVDGTSQEAVWKKDAAAFDYFCVGTPEAPVGEYVTQDHMTYYVDEDSAELCFTDDAYYQSDKKKEIVIPDTVDGKPVTAIGYRAFAVGGPLTHVTESISIPGTVKMIGENAAAQMFGVKKVIIRGESSLEHIGGGAFSGCPLTDYFGEEAEAEAVEKGTVVIPDSVKTIGESAFSNHMAVNEGEEYHNVYIPNSVTEIGENAFGDHLWLEKVEFEAGSKATVGKGAFGYDGNSNIEPNSGIKIQEIIVGEGADLTFAENAFQNVSQNATITIPPTTDVGSGAFPDLKDKTYTVTFDSKGGPAVSAQTGKFGEKLTLPVPERSEYQFKGWYLNEACQGAPLAEISLTADVTLYAKWELKEEPPAPPVVTYYDITAEQPEHGSIKLSTDRIYRYGDVEVTLTPEEGYEVKDLLINGKSVGAVSAYTIKSVTEDIHVTAVFGETEAAKNDRIAKGVENTTIRMYYKKNEIGKGWIKLRFKKSFGFKVDNYEIFRSAKKKTNFGDEAWFVTKTNKASGYYKNGKNVKKGTRYFYKMRGVREIGGQTYYTKWSNTVMRTGR